MIALLPTQGQLAELHPIASFLDTAPPLDIFWETDDPPDYWYQGYDPRTGGQHSLPRTAQAKALARGLIEQLKQAPWSQREGKMYGVLLVQTADGQPWVLKAFSGTWPDTSPGKGWVPALSAEQRVDLQAAYTRAQLSEIKAQLLVLQGIAERQTYAQAVAELDQQRQMLNQVHQQRKQARNRQRSAHQSRLTGEALALAEHNLDQASRRDKAELRAFKQTQHQRLGPLEAAIQAADAEIAALRRQRRDLSRQLQTALHATYTLTNFAGETRTLQELASTGSLPTGTGDCCAPKLLQFAARHGLKPLALAEFWWGPAASDKQPGQFYGACQERCQPIMGFLLGGLSAVAVSTPTSPLPILYEDEYLVVVNKPAGLPSVPGRYTDSQDSVLTRLRHTRPDGDQLRPVHRLDQATSGVLVLALTPETQRQLCQQFEQRQVAKTYLAILDGHPTQLEGTITLPLWGNPAERPRQSVDWTRGKPSQTRFQVIDQAATSTRVRFFPITGRTHQLRVHAAHPMGLNTPILGDCLYGRGTPAPRLYLHAENIEFTHPDTHRQIIVKANTPF
ncbi:MAG: pseudouridine synthase [Nodosilinea sp.]